MPAATAIHTFLSHPDTLSFTSNRPYAANLQAAGARIVQQPSGHFVLYGRHGRRLLLVDPEGNPLHECEWEERAGGMALTRARVYLDWGQWVGLRPGGVSNVMTLDLSKKPGWQRLRADDLRQMAARAMQVPIEEVRLFYEDQDLLIDHRGMATIRHKKDALYVLPDGTFEQAKFMACMGAMHWDRIDFLPVVELFQSLLPGTGSAVFELIRGLYDDQNEHLPTPLPLRYRGIPTYPSEAAFRLFSHFFVPHAPPGDNPFAVFMDPPRSHRISWLPASGIPRRYVGRDKRICVTIKNQVVEKVTCADDCTGMSYGAATGHRPPPCERTAGVEGNELILNDRGRRTTLTIDPRWGPVVASVKAPVFSTPLHWSDAFQADMPSVSPAEAFSAVLLYPDDESEIGELASQPFVMDYLQDLLEQEPLLGAQLARADRVLIHRFDGAITACIHADRSRDYTVLYQSVAFAQKHAQMLWNQLAASRRLDWFQHIKMHNDLETARTVKETGYDLVYEWIPFAAFNEASEVKEMVRVLHQRMDMGALAYVVGPDSLSTLLRQQVTLAIEMCRSVDSLPTVHIHRNILPRARLKTGLTLYRLRRQA
ncbi:MAG: hypothetical protein ACREIM_06120 [Nitrospiraceae bacterium]